MNQKTKHFLAYASTIAVAIVGIIVTIKYAGKGTTNITAAAPPGNGSSQPGGTQLGAPTINIIGGSDPTTWNITPQTMPTGGDKGGYPISGNSNSLSLPVITNYNTTQNGGCNSCASVPEAYYASAIQANEFITAAMEKEMGATKIGNQVLPPGYYNLTGLLGQGGM